MFQSKAEAMLFLDSSLFNIFFKTFKSDNLERVLDYGEMIEKVCRDTKCFFFSTLEYDGQEFKVEYEIWELRRNTLES